MENILETLQTIHNERHGLSSSMSTFNFGLYPKDKDNPQNIEFWESSIRELQRKVDKHIQRQGESTDASLLKASLATIEEEKDKLIEIAEAGQATLEYLYQNHPDQRERLIADKQRIDILQAELAEKVKRLPSQ